MNKKAIEFAVRMGLACGCEIAKTNYFARKNYFYPDLPKGYQVSQHTTPVCKGGSVKISAGGKERDIRLNRIHLEEDAGKSLHDADEANTCIDYNRAGTPLIEIVSEPDLRSGEEAFAYLTGIRKMVRYLEICDGNMEEGSLRCDANISVRKKGESQLGTKVEIKNLNSIRNVKRAIETEATRLIALLENGETVIQQTRGFDANSGTSFATREKEDANDYRYFAEPDLTPFHLNDEFIENIRRSIPELQEQKITRYVSKLGLSAYDAAVLTDEKAFADYFEELVAILPSPRSGEGQGMTKAAANWMLGPVRSWLNENNTEVTAFPLPAKKMAELIDLVDTGQVNFSLAAARIFPVLLGDPVKTAKGIAAEQNLVQDADTAAIERIIDKILEKYADKVVEYKNGKKGLLALFIGEVRKESRGKADPRVTNKLLLDKLK